MPITRTPNTALQKPAATDRNWDVPLNANTDALDAIQAIGALAVTQAEYPSASLNVKVAPGSFITQSGAYLPFAGEASMALPTNATTLVWLADDGTLSSGSSWPSTAHVRLASVVTSTTTVTTIIDKRTPYRSATT
jgi:hypothetical protein